MLREEIYVNIIKTVFAKYEEPYSRYLTFDLIWLNLNNVSQTTCSKRMLGVSEIKRDNPTR